VLLGVVVGAAGGDKTNTKTESSAQESQAPQNNESNKEEIAGIGTAVKDGKFEFTVKSFECGKPSVGTNEFMTKTAQGQFCLLNVSVKNIGNEKQSLLSSNQKLLNGQNEYSADDVATMYAAPQGSTWYSDINPGNSVEGAIVFDVPKDVTPSQAKLFDSAFSNGVKVNLQ
jgi:hypothetical protein